MIAFSNPQLKLYSSWCVCLQTYQKIEVKTTPMADEEESQAIQNRGSYVDL
ncbi:hypothetical protein [Fischerella sp. JS2]|uniref:hypothetical protein n=1 Tax=Fischerella sp. JS2 TaxID=2597771 RepID=UPI0028ED3065|nr:hypothetical protein [Fischerella sp. JS2]